MATVDESEVPSQEVVEYPVHPEPHGRQPSYAWVRLRHNVIPAVERIAQGLWRLETAGAGRVSIGRSPKNLESMS